MNRTPITPSQEKQYRRFIEDAAKHGANLALKKVLLDKDGLQKLFGRGGELKTAIAGVIVAKTRELSEPTRNWLEQDGVIYFSVTSDGTTGKNWITRLESKGFRIGDYTKQVLRSPDFKPTNGVTTEVAVLKGMLFEDNDRITKKIHAKADKRKLTKPNAELACLIRKKFADSELEAMGLWWIIAMHEPIKDSVGDPYLLSTDRYATGRWLSADCGRPGLGWNRDGGFAFAVSQVGSQN